MPPEWRALKASSGKLLSKTARQLLSLIVSRLDVDNSVDKVSELQESYYFFQQELGVCQRRVRQCLLELQQSGFIYLELKDIIYNNIKCRNILGIKLVKNFQCYLQKVSGEVEKTFRAKRKDFQPHNIIDNNISIISKNRYVDSIDRLAKSNFSENNLGESDIEISNSELDTQEELQDSKKEQVTITASGSSSINQQGDDSSIPNNDSSSWIGKITSKAKKWCAGKKLAEFHPLTEEDGELLRQQSGRDFNLSFINKLLLRLSEQRPNNQFYHKKAVLSYMTDALKNEMRQATFVNNVNFNFKRDDIAVTQEQYLQEVEYSKDISQQGQLKRRIASVFEPDIAYKLLTSCCLVGADVDQYRIELLQQIDFGEYIETTLLHQVQAVYGDKVKQLQLIPRFEARPQALSNSKNNEASYLEQLLQQLNPKSVWCKVRQYLIDDYGVNIDKSWFSKLEVIEEDKVNNKLTLKPSNRFIGDWISQNYDNALRHAFEAQNFTFELIRV